MSSKVATFAATPDPTHGRQPEASRSQAEGEPKAPAAPDPVDLRLVIEEDQASGSYVYKTVNRITGEVVLQLPRDQILKLKDEVSYVAGAVIRAKA